jgi:hypothetical protein
LELKGFFKRQVATLHGHDNNVARYDCHQWMGNGRNKGFGV